MPTIALVGDIFLQQELPRTAEIAAVADVLRGADIAFGNLETPVSERGTPIDKWINMRMPPALLSEVAAMGFDIMTLANNHMWDFGEVAFFDTLRHMGEYGLPAVGAGADLDAAWRAEFITLIRQRASNSRAARPMSSRVLGAKIWTAQPARLERLALRRIS